MTDAEKAYAAAEKLVEKAIEEGKTTLGFSGEEFNALERVPERIGEVEGLWSLNMTCTAIEDVEPLAVLQSLNYLDLSYTKVSEITPLSRLVNLVSLDLIRTKVQNIAPLTELKSLESLSLDGISTDDFAPLSSIFSLKYLQLFGANIDDLEIFKPLSNLKDLLLDSASLRDLSAVSQLHKLQHLDIDNTEVSDLRPLLDLPNFQSGEFTLLLRNTPATTNSQELKRISEIKDSRERAQKTRDYLQTLPPWPDPLPLDLDQAPISAESQVSELGKRMHQISEELQSSQNFARERSAEMETINKELSTLQKSASTALDDTKKSIEDSLKQLRSEQEEQFKSKIEALSAAIDTQSKKLSDFTADADTRIKTANDEYKSSIEAAAAAFTEELTFSEPVELWKAKQTEHESSRDQAYKLFQRGLGAIIAVVVLIVGSLILSPSLADAALSPIGCDRAKPDTCNGFGLRGFIVSGATLTLLTVMLWFTRLQMKLYLAERHMVLDARERQAFAQTYLGFLKEGDTSKEAQDQRAAVYMALFRPSSDGTIREEGGLDPAISAAVSKLLTKG
ncbi:MAG: hypothetical protein HRU30_07445 [Rhodobacteraceae bacterium]|nr:hypothetical protein [Paracoccaceae bacterium]